MRPGQTNYSRNSGIQAVTHQSLEGVKFHPLRMVCCEIRPSDRQKARNKNRQTHHKLGYALQSTKGKVEISCHHATDHRRLNRKFVSGPHKTAHLFNRLKSRCGRLERQNGWS